MYDQMSWADKNNFMKAGIIFCMLLWCVSGIMCALSVEDEGLCIVILIFLSAMCFVGISALMEDYTNEDLQKNCEIFIER